MKKKGENKDMRSIFMAKGIVTNAVDDKIRYNGAEIERTVITLEETTEGAHPQTYYYNIDFIGVARKNLPQTYGNNNGLVGANCIITGYLIGRPFNGKPIISLRGDKFLLITLASYESQSYSSSKKPRDDEDNIPF